MSRYLGKQILLNKPIIEETKNIIRKRLKGECSIEYYLQWYKDYFAFKSIDIKCKDYKNITNALNTLCKNRIFVDGKVNFLIEKVSGGQGSYAMFVLPKDQIIKLIEEVKNENTSI